MTTPSITPDAPAAQEPAQPNYDPLEAASVYLEPNSDQDTAGMFAADPQFDIYDNGDSLTVGDFNLPEEWDTWSCSRKNGLEKAVHSAVLTFRKYAKDKNDNLPESDEDYARIVLDVLKLCPAATLKGKLYEAADYMEWGDINDMITLSREEVSRANFIEKAVSKILKRVPTGQSAVAQAQSVIYFTCTNVMSRIWENICMGATEQIDSDSFDDDLSVEDLYVGFAV